MTRVSRLTVLTCALALGACGGSANKKPPETAAGSATALNSDIKGTGGERCRAGAGREISEYDTSGDGRPDVRKVFVALGTGVDARMVIICRETDVNGDGKKDVIRYYDDEGATLREESDRDFDGKMDLTLIFQNGKIVREELDENRDGIVDTKVFLDNGQPTRAERDLKGRSTASTWHPDRWEYYEKGHMVRMGTDLDGDSRVDRWDRDAEITRQDEQADEQQQAAADAQADAQAQTAETANAPVTSKPADKSKASASAKKK